MNKLFLGIALCGLSTLTQANTDLSKGPMELTLDQMDSVTSGTVAVSIVTDAWAGGPQTMTYTNANTQTGEFSRRGVTVEYGVGVGVAVACCGPNSGTSIEAGAYGEGDITRTRTFTNSNTNSWYSTSTGYATVFAITFEDGATPSRKFVKKMKKRVKRKLRRKVNRMSSRM